jgi:hypothetical protein
VLAGLPLRVYYPTEPDLADALLVCATEVTTSDEIARFAAALGEVLGQGSGEAREPAGVT